MQLSRPVPILAEDAEQAPEILFARQIIDPVSQAREGSLTKHRALHDIRRAYRRAAVDPSAGGALACRAAANNGVVTTTTHTCPACGYRFNAAPGKVYCSGLCAGQLSLFSLIAAAQQAARVSGRR